MGFNQLTLIRALSWRELAPGLLLALVVAGYPIAGFITAVGDVGTSAISISFRVLVLALALYVFIRHCDGRVFAGIWVFLLVSLWVLYGIRLTADSLTGIASGAGEALVFYCGVVLAPSLALLFADRQRTDEVAGPAVLLLGGAVAGCALACEYSGAFGAHSLLAATGRLSTDTVNPITLGHTAAGAILAAFAMRNQRGGLWRTTRLIITSVSIAGVVLAASKGVMVALLAALIFRVLAERVTARGLGWGLLVLALVVIAAVTVDYSEYSLWQRFAAINEDESTRYRLRLIQDSFDQFVLNPIAGSAYVEVNSGTYPHNLVLESFMSLGILGGVTFVFLSVAGIYRAWKLIQSGVVLIPLLFIQAYVGGLLSGALYAHASLWATLAIILRPSRAFLAEISWKPKRRRARSETEGRSQ